jgi:hypothetical protein
MNARAADRELRMFKGFAVNAPLTIIADSVESRPPPEPDILCASESGETIAFELVELIDEGYARAISDMFKTKKMLDDLPGGLPTELKADLTKSFPGGAFISFDFSHGLPLRKRERASIDALRWIVAREANDGHFPTEGELRERVPLVHVHPWEWGLQFDSSLFTRLTDPTMDRLASKFGKTYETAHPIELLMYTEIDLLFPDSVWRPTVVPYIDENLEESPFRRVWLFKAGAGTIDYVYPGLGT